MDSAKLLLYCQIQAFDGIRPIFDKFNERLAAVFECSFRVVIDELLEKLGKQRTGSSCFFKL